MKGKMLVVLACTILVQITTAGYTEYNQDNCPICYNPKLNIPPQCTRDEADETRTEACDDGEICVVWLFKDQEIPQPYDTMNHQKVYNAMYFCGLPTELSQFKPRKPGVVKNVEATTQQPTGNTSPTTSNPFEMSKANTESTEGAAVTDDPATETSTIEDDTCDAGNVLNGKECEPCPLHTYSEADDSAECTSCPEGNVTASTGSSSAADCLDACGPGYHYHVKSAACKACPLSKYSDNPEHNTECTECPEGEVTAGTGSTSVAECLACGPGQYLHQRSKSCRECAEHHYSEHEVHNPKCTLCPEGMSSEGGSDSIDDCVNITCEAGNYVKLEIRYCSACPDNTYMAENDHSHTACTDCEAGTTSTTGSRSADDCTGPIETTDEPPIDGGSKVLESSFMILSLASILVFRF